MSGLYNSGIRESFACDAAGVVGALQRGEAAQDVRSRRSGSAGRCIGCSEVKVPTSIAGVHDRARKVSVGRSAS